MALAQAAAGAAPAASEAIQEVVVTAQRRSEDILDVPYNISAVSGQAILPPHVLQHRGTDAVGAGYLGRGSRGPQLRVVSGIRIRGLNVDSSALGDYAVSAVATVSTYVDDTPLYANFLLKDIQRVEVLRGPQGTLYGSGSLGGTVRYVMNQPQFGEFSANARRPSLSSVDGSDGIGLRGRPHAQHAGRRHLCGAPQSSAAPARSSTPLNLYVLDDESLPVAPNGVLAPGGRVPRSKKDADNVDIWYGRLAVRWEPSETFNATLSGFLRAVRRRRRPPAVDARSDGFGNPYQDYGERLHPARAGDT